MKKILLIDAHPDEGRFSSALLVAYEEGAKEAGFNVSRLTVRDLGTGSGIYGKKTPLHH